MFVDLLVGRLDERQGLSGPCGVPRRGEVLLFSSLVKVEIVAIRMWVGSCDENACDEKSDSCEGAAEFWNT